MKRGQYSVEFLYTYGWAFLALMGVLAVLSMSGVFNFNQYLPESCSIFGQAECMEFRLAQTGVDQGTISIVVGNDFGTNLEIHSFTMRGSGYTCTLNTSMEEEWSISGKAALSTDCTGSAFTARERVNGILEFQYYRDVSWCTPGATPNADCLYTLVGEVQGRVI